MKPLFLINDKKLVINCAFYKVIKKARLLGVCETPKLFFFCFPTHPTLFILNSRDFQSLLSSSPSGFSKSDVDTPNREILPKTHFGNSYFCQEILGKRGGGGGGGISLIMRALHFLLLRTGSLYNAIPAF